MLKLIEKSFRDKFIEVYGHKMHIPSHGFDTYVTHGIYGELDTFTVEKIVKKDDVVLDIGAAIGYYTLILARLVGPKGKVFAFQPKKSRYELLNENIKNNGYDNVQTENVAILH